jgi:hypothetical protein
MSLHYSGPFQFFLNFFLLVSRPLHIAVVQGKVKVVEQLIAMMRLMSASVDHPNALWQVCSLAFILHVYRTLGNRL